MDNKFNKAEKFISRLGNIETIRQFDKEIIAGLANCIILRYVRETDAEKRSDFLNKIIDTQEQFCKRSKDLCKKPDDESNLTSCIHNLAQLKLAIDFIKQYKELESSIGRDEAARAVEDIAGNVKYPQSDVNNASDKAIIKDNQQCKRR